MIKKLKVKYKYFNIYNYMTLRIQESKKFKRIWLLLLRKRMKMNYLIN